MNHPAFSMRSGFFAAALLSATCAGAAPTIVTGPVVEVCSATCDPIGGVGLAGDQLGILVDDAGAATWVVFDRATGSEVSSTVLGNSAGFQMQDVAPDGSGGAWLVGFSDTLGQSTPGRWHTSDLVTRQTPSGINGTSDLLLTAVASDGTAFGVSDTSFATRILVDGTAVDMNTGLNAELPTSISGTTADGSASAGAAQSSGILTLAAWDGDTLAFQDSVAGGNGVIGRRLDGTLVMVGIRVGNMGPEIAAFTDPFGSPVVTSITGIATGELAGMDRDDFGYVFGSFEGEAALIDTNSMGMLLLGDAGLSGYESLVDMHYLGATDWLLVLRGSSHYSLATITTGNEDQDGDGVFDSTDNCLQTANAAQIDADGDLIGNVCDPDFNNDCIINVIDLGILKGSFFTPNPVVDMNSDGIVNVIDLGTLKTRFFQAPGPGAPGNVCE